MPLAGAVVALIWANSPWSDRYEALLGLVAGPSALHLNLSLAAWAADGLLAVFFFVAGLELKREFVAGDLRDPRRPAVIRDEPMARIWPRPDADTARRPAAAPPGVTPDLDDG
jgi:Na+/H+ antiporter NhaA